MISARLAIVLDYAAAAAVLICLWLLPDHIANWLSWSAIAIASLVILVGFFRHGWAVARQPGVAVFLLCGIAMTILFLIRTAGS